MTASSRRPVIVCVDDEQNVLKSLKRVLLRDHYIVHIFTSGAEAIQFLEKESDGVDLIISDMRMPEMSGSELLQHVSSQWPQITRILLTGYSDAQSTISAINDGHIFSYIQKPWNDKHLLQTLQQAWHYKSVSDEKTRLQELTEKNNIELKDLNKNLDKKVKERTVALSNTVNELETANLVLKNQHMSSIRFMANMLECRNSRSSGHARFVADLGLAIAEKLALSDEEQENLYHAALIHDIGLISLPDQILETSYARLQDADRKRYQEHTLIGEKLLLETPALSELAKIVRQHHEHFDGSGYPDGLSGDKTSLLAQIIALSSDYHELLNGMLLGKQLKAREAQEYLIKKAGYHYSPDLVRIALEVLVERQAAAVQSNKNIEALTDDMELQVDFYTPDGVLLLAKGTMLDRQLIQKLEQQSLQKLSG